ncbi:hypothetical protein [Undibacterium sp. SXout20W]|uniref:RIFT barrel domain-containing protein n=1 Tax=Undibacterium sp. SXout20W TaxID=3413051 RepID=UPI003BF11F70
MKLLPLVKCSLILFLSAIFPSLAHSDQLPSASPIIGEIRRDSNGHLIATNAAEAGKDVLGGSKASQTTNISVHEGRGSKKSPILGALTDVVIENTGTRAQTEIPITFGQAFTASDLTQSDGLIGKTVDGATIPLQINVKASYPDGSIKHAIISAIVPAVSVENPLTFGLVKVEGGNNSISSNSKFPPTSTSALLTTDFNATINVSIDGQMYTASAVPMLKKGAYKTWLSGPIVNEWQVLVPLVSAAGITHPQLVARFYVRSYSGINAVKVDAIIENVWAYINAPQNVTCNVNVDVGGHNVYAKTGLTHYAYSRWRKSFWWGKTPDINIKENTAYLIASKAVPNYDQSFSVSDIALTDLWKRWSGNKIEPMGTGLALAYMPTTGGRGDIGLLPGWATMYLLSMDKRARDVTLGMADLAGSWSIHYRDRQTDRPISILNHPYITLLGHRSDTFNPATKKYEEFPECLQCKSENTADSAHEPAFNYLPYLLTGDYYQLEELQFWAAFNAFESNPGYRGNILGLVNWNQLRGQAWGLRTIGEAAFITPDADPLKGLFQSVVTNNLAWFNAHYSNNPDANNLGIIVDGATLVYENGTGIAPWQDDFFTAAIGRLAELGFPAAKPLLQYKAKFPVSRINGPGFCWIFGSVYKMSVRSTPSGKFFSNIAQTFRPSAISNYGEQQGASIAQMSCDSSEMSYALKLRSGEMLGYANSSEGFPSNLQPALAYSVDSGVAGAKDAWQKFISRSVKPDYSKSPQFAIVPR